MGRDAVGIRIISVSMFTPPNNLSIGFVPHAEAQTKQTTFAMIWILNIRIAQHHGTPRGNPRVELDLGLSFLLATLAFAPNLILAHGTSMV